MGIGNGGIGNGGTATAQIITQASDFPTLAQVKIGGEYIIVNVAGVTDNDPTKTDTGQFFPNGSFIIWNGVNWTEVLIGGVIGPASSTIGAVPIFSVTTGTVIANTAVTITGAGLNVLNAASFVGALTGNASTATALATARAIYGNNFDGTASLTQIITSVYGGTGNGFTKFSGATTSEKTYTLPNASCNILTDNALVTIAQGGTGQGTAQAAFNALAPSQTGQAGNFLTTDGTNTSWSANPLGTVTTVSVVSANGFAGTVANATTTPAITISTSITGLLKGNGTAISAATAGTDYVTATSTNTFTNKTYDTAGTGNAFAINGTSITSVTGTGAVALANSPIFTTPNIGSATGSISGNAATATLATNSTNVATVQVSTNASYYPLFAASSTNGNQAPNLGTGLTFNPSTNTLTTTTFVGAFTGTVTNATNIGITNDTSTNATMYPLWVTATSGNLPAKVTSSGLTFNPSTGTLTTTSVTCINSGGSTVLNFGDPSAVNSLVYLFAKGNTSTLDGEILSIVGFNKQSGSLVQSHALNFVHDGASADNKGAYVFQAIDGTGSLVELARISSGKVISAGGLNLSGLTASQLVATDGSSNLQTLTTATYPSLTEISYVKGVTSAIQTQLNAKSSSTLTSAHIFVGNVSNVATDVALSGDATLANTGALTLATVNTNVGTFGSATQSSQVTVNGKGLVTAASNVTITPAVGSITGLGTGVITALAVNVGSAGAFVTFNGALGTPSSGTATNLTGTASGLTAGNVTTNANLTGVITSSGNATSIASQTGTGTKFVVDTSPTLVTPILGVASATSLATSAASPLLLTNGQLVTIALTSQTVGGTTLTIPDFASVVDEFTFKTKAQTMSNKTFVTPVLGVATATSINKMAITAPATSSTLAVADGKTATISNTLTFTGTDSSSIAFGAGGTVLYSVPSGCPVQTVGNQTGALATGTGTFSIDNNVPTNSNGNQYLSQAITPTSSTNKLYIEVIFNCSTSLNTPGYLVAALFQDSTSAALAVAAQQIIIATGPQQLIISYEMTAGTTSSTTFKVRGGSTAASTTAFNGAVGGGGIYGGTWISSIKITEIKV